MRCYEYLVRATPIIKLGRENFQFDGNFAVTEIAKAFLLSGEYLSFRYH